MIISRNSVTLIFRLFVALLMSNSLSAQNAEFEWVNTIGGNSSDYGRATHVDAFGDVYTVGHFVGTVDFDPGLDTFNVTSSVNSDVFILKLDAGGNFIWVKSIGGIQPDYVESITTDISGNVYLSGSFQDTTDFDPGPATFNLISNGTTDAYILKLDSSGNFIWARSMGSTSNDVAYSIALDNAGYAYVTGRFYGTVDFNQTGTPYILTSQGSTDIFIQKLDASGNLIWVVPIGDSGEETAKSIVLDSDGYLYVCGEYMYTVDFDPGPTTFNMTSNGGDDIFVLKLDTSASFIWAKTLGGAAIDGVSDMTFHDSGNLYLTGVFRDSADFDPGVATFNMISNGNADCFIVKIDTAGDFVWAKALGGVSNVGSSAIATDSSGNVYILGSYRDTADFDPSGAILHLSSKGNTDIFIVKLTASGNLTWARSIGGSSWDNGRGLSLDPSQNLYLTGYYINTIDFDPGPGIFNMTATSNDIYILKLTQCPTSSSTDSITACVLYTWMDGITYTSNNNSATYTFSGGASNGCDSIVTLDLTITPLDIGITQLLDDTWFANATSGTFQWIECAKDSILPGETNVGFEPLADGSYAVIITDNGCSDTSTCTAMQVVGINKLRPNRVNVYPNPVYGEVTFEFKNKKQRLFTVYNSTGQEVISIASNEKQTEINTKYLASGLYFYQIQSNSDLTISGKGIFVKH